MKYHYLLVLVLISLVLCDVQAQARKRKRVRKPTTSTEAAPAQDIYRILEKDEEAQHRQVELERENERARESVDVPAEPPGQEIIDNRVPISDPCSKVHCGAGRICQVDDLLEPLCVCVEICPEETEPRRKVCSNHNETWTSDCAVYQHRCFCDVGDPRCRGDDYRHVHIEYYGECRNMPECGDDEMADFPRRMRDWLFNIMRDLADRQELPDYYLKLQREAETNLTRRWANAAVWKWCDLDGHPHDRSVSRHELFPIRAPLMALEHCIAPFLDGCDTDDNHRITFTEWAKCLDLNEDDIDEKCEELDDVALNSV